MKATSKRRVSNQLPALALLALACSSGGADGEDVGQAQQAVIGVDSFLYLTCNATGWQPNDATRLRATSDPNVYEVSYEVTQPWMVSGSDNCVILETSQQNAWGNWQKYYGAPGSGPLTVPGTRSVVQNAGYFSVKYPATGSYRARVDWQSRSISVQAANTTSDGHDLRVMLVGFNPSGGGTTLADRYFSYLYGGLTADQVEDESAARHIEAFDRLSQGRIRYEVVHKIHDRTFPVYSDGSSYTMDSYAACLNPQTAAACETRKWQFQHEDWVARNQICELANQYDVDEIWMMSAPYIATWENFMIGPTPGFGVNGPSYVTPACNKHIVVHNPTYQAEPQAFLHIVGHRVEDTLENTITPYFRPEDKQNHWERFAAHSRYAFPSGVILDDLPNPYCGNAHFASNSQQHYDYGNPRTRTSTCVDWANFPNYTGATQSLDCTAWGCSDNGWGEFWMGSLPHGSGSVTMTTSSGQSFGFPKDWWSLLLYPDATLAFIEQF